MMTIEQRIDDLYERQNRLELKHKERRDATWKCFKMGVGVGAVVGCIGTIAIYIILSLIL